MSDAKTESTPRWTAAFQRLWTLHWVMVICFLVIYPVGLVMTRLPGDVGFRFSLYNLHKSLGVLVIGLLLVRIFTLLQVFSKKYLKHKPRISQQWLLSVVLHAVLYGFMLVVPMTGIWFSNSAGFPAPLFVVNLPNLFEKNPGVVDLAEALHVWLAYTLAALVVLHAFEQQQFIKRMWRRRFK